MSYEADVQIDRESLDHEWLTQPGLYFKYAKEAEDVQDEVKQLKQELAVNDAEAEDEIRTKAKDKEEKITDKYVAAQIVLDKNHQKLSEEIDAKEHELRILKNAAIPAMDQKRSALENLVKLYLAGYWASPSEPKGSKYKDEAIEKADERMTENLGKDKGKRTTRTRK